MLKGKLHSIRKKSGMKMDGKTDDKQDCSK